MSIYFSFKLFVSLSVTLLSVYLSLSLSLAAGKHTERQANRDGQGERVGTREKRVRRKNN